jgi:surface adhesion protein
MPTIVQTVNGKVTGLWGSALRRMPNGKLVPLKMGDEVHKGDVILTTQDGLVQLTPLPDAPGLAAKPTPPTDDEIDRVIAELNEPDSQTAPAAGLTGADGGGLQPGLRVGRIAEDVTPVSLAQTAGVEPAGTVPTFTTATAPENQAAATPGTPNDRPTATPATVSGNEDATLPISLGGSDTDGTVTAVTIVNLPANGTLLLADGVTAVTAGQTLTPAQAAGLVFRPAPDFNGGVVVEFTVTDNQGSVSAIETVSITVLPVNDTPLANAGIATAGPEYSSIPVNLGGTDVDGTVTSITITSPPAGGSLFLADGVTPVVPGTALTPAQAANLVFVPNPGFTGSTPIGFTVTDNEGASSSAAVAQVNVTPVPTTVTLSSSAPAVAEGGSVVYTATVDHPVAGAALVITLSNGSSVTIPVGQTSGSSAPVVPRADDAYVQGTQTQTIGVTSTSGGNFSSLVTTSTVATSVSDDSDSTTVSLSASAASVTEGGSIVYTATLTSPVTGSPLVVTLSNGQTITIPVGASSGSSAPFAVRADDAQLQGTETLNVNITGTAGGNFEALTPTGTATTTVTDDADVSTVTLTASAASVVEGGSITYTATTSSPVAGSPLVVTLSNGATITIPVGASSASSAPIAVRADDTQVQGPETVTASITGTSGGSYESLSATGTPSTTVTDNADGSTLTLSASTASVAEGGSVTYTASVTAPVTGSPLVVTLSNGQTITIPVGASSASSAPFAVRADDAYAQGDQTLSVTVTGTTGGAYEALATTGTATTVVSDDTDATTATLTASAASVTEGGSIVYTATLNNVVTGSPVVLTLSNGQTITIPVGASSASSAPFAVRADDANAQGTDTLNVGITTTSGGNFEVITAGSSVSTTVTDDADPTTVTVSASAANVTEGGSIVYTVSLSNAVSGSPLTVTLSNGQSVTIPVGASSASTAAFNVRADDVNVQADDTLTVTVTGSTGGNFEALTPTGSAVTTVSDDADVSTVTLSSSAASVAEGGSVVYTASVSAPVVGAPLVISLTNGQTITIPVGQSTADSAPFAVRADDHFVQGAQSFSVGIAGTSGGSYEALATTSTVSTTVTDDADVSTVTLSATPSVAEGGTIVYTATLSSAAQTAVVVTLANGAIINIAAGASSGTVNVAAPTDDVFVDAGSVSQTIASATGGNFESLQVNPAAASTTVTDTIDATTVSLTGDPTLSEAGSAGYTVSLTSVAQTDVTVTLTYSGTAANGADFSGTTTVTIPAGSSSASFSVAAIDDALAEGPESFTVAIGGATGGNFESLVISGANGAVTTGIVDNDISTVSLSATPTLTEAGGTIVYTASVTQAPTTALDVTLSNGAVITIAAGALSGTASVPVAASDDVYVDPTSVSATIASTSGGGIPLAVDPAPAVTTITDTVDTAEVRLQAQPTVSEGGMILYTAVLSHPAQTAVTVTLSTGDTLTINAGSAFGALVLPAPSDDVHVDAGNVSVTITQASGGNFENLTVNPTPAVTAITDTVDTTTLSLTATPAVAEGGTIVYTATLTSQAQTDVTVTLSNSAVITIAAGASVGTVTVPAPADDVYTDAGNTSVTIATASGGNFENLVVNPAPAVTAVSDTADTSTVTLTATPSVAEGGNIVYTATLSAPAQSDVTVTLSNGATLTILANTSSGSVPVAAPTDDVYLDAGSVSVTITNASGGNFENLVRNPAAAVTTITDTVDNSTVSLTASPAVAEGGNIVYTATLSAPAQSAVTVTLSNNATITIAAGASTGTVSVPAPTDDVYTDASSVSATISTATGGNFESLTVNPAAAITAITDTVDTTTVSLTATPAVAEGGSVVYTASLTSVAQGPVTVTLQSGTTITIPNGASSASITVPAPGDDVYADASTVSDRIVSAAGGSFETLVVSATPAVTTVSDTIATTTVSLTATATVAEGGNITYTASLTAPAQTPVTVTLSDNSTITIPAGASSASISLPAPTDDVIVDAGSVSLHITGATGGNFEALAVNATPAVSTVTDTVDTTTVSLTGTPSVAEGGTIVYTASLTAPADSAVTVRLSNNAVITIAAGASSGSITVPAPTDDVYNDAGNVSVRIDSASGGNFENLAVNAAPVITAVSDTVDTTTVSLTATPAVAEGGSIVYTASLTSPAQGNVTVTLQSGATITILSGASSGSVTVPAPADDVIVDAGSVSNRITGATGGNFENLAVDATPVTTAVSDTLDTTTVSLSGSGSVIEGNAGSYTVSLTSAAQTAVTVTLTYSGTAANGSDFTGVTTVTIPAGSSSASFSIATIDDAAAEGSENFTVAIGSATGGNFENLVVSAANASVTTGIVDNDVSVVSLSATPAITEAGGGVVYTATLTQAPVSNLTVTLSNGATITVTAGSLSGTVTVPVTANEDVYVDPTSISASITGTSGGGIALSIDPTPATTAVNDTIDTTTVSLSATPTVAEGGSIVYTATLTSAAQSPVTVNLSNGQQITIATGATTGTLTLAAPGDDALVDAGPVSVSITSASGGNFESLVRNPAPAVTTVTDTVDTTTVTLTASPTVAEGGNIVYTATLNNAAGTAVTVTLSNGAQIVIAAGTSSNSISVPAPGDDVYADAGNVSATITATSGGNFESLAVNPAAAVTAVTDTVNNTTVTLTATPTVAEGGNIVYTASLTSAAQSPVTVTLSNGQQITIPANAASATLTLPAPADDAVVDAGPVSLTIASATGGNFENLVVNPAAATTTVSDTVDTTTVSLTATGSVAEGGNIVYTASLTSPAGSDVTITLSNNAVITIVAGASSGSVSVPAPGEDVLLDASTVSASIATANGGNFEQLVVDTTPAATAVTDTIDTTTVSLTATPTVAEGGNIVYTASLNNPAGTNVTITLSNSAVITILAGNSTGTVTVPAPADDFIVDAGPVSATIATATGGNFESLAINPAPATTAVTDTLSTTTLTLSATGTVAEGGSIVYTASLTSPTGTDLVVTLSNSQTITIPAGASSASISVAAPTDDALIDAGSVSASITGTSGGNFENLSVNSAPATTSIADTIDTTTVTLTATGTVAEGGNIVYTASLNNPAGTDVTITLSNNAVITILAGASTGTVTVAAPGDDALVDAGPVSATITTATGGNFESLAISPTAAVTTVTDTVDTTTATLTATPSVAEGGSIVYTASLNAAAGSPVTITLSNGAQINIAAGASSGSVSVLAPSDDVYLDASTVSAHITGASGGNFENLVADNTPVSTGITDTINTTTVSLSGSGSVAEGASGSYTVSLTSPAQTNPVTVTLSYSGTAADGSDFTGVTTVTIPAGSSSASFSVATIDDALAEGAESFTVTLVTATGGNFENLAVSGSASSVTTGIVDNDISTLTLSATPTLTEAGGTIVYTATLTQAPVTALDVTLSNGQTIHINAGALTGTVTVPVAASDDVYVDPTSVSATITGTTGGGIALSVNPTPAVTSIVDTIDTTTVTLTASAGSVTEGGSVVYTASVNNLVTSSPLVITLTNGQTITIPVGQSSASSAPFAVRGDDAYVQGTQPLNVGIASTSGANFEALNTTSTVGTSVIDDADVTTVTLTSSAATVTEGGSITYTATVNNAVTGSPLVVTLSNGQTITIPVGASSASSAAFAVRGDDAYVQGTQAVAVSINGTSGGNYEALNTTSTTSTTVTDDADATTVGLTASAANVAEGGSITYTATVNNPVTGSPLVITLTNGQTITIPVGQSSGTSAAFAVRPDDANAQGDQTLTVGISSTSGGNFEALTTTATASTVVSDDGDATTVSLSASAPAVLEGGSIVYTATASAVVTGSPLVVTLSNGQTITIPVGQSSASSAAFAVRGDDAYVQGTDTVSVTITGTSGANFEAVTTTGTATTTVTDDADATTVSLTASTASIAEGGSIVYTATVNNAVTGSPLVITLDNGQTITIPVGQSSASSTPFAVRGDDAYVQGNQAVTVGISSTSGANFETLTTTSTASTTVTDDADASVVTLTASTGSVTEGGSITYTASVSNAVTGSPLVISLSNGQSITIPVGQSSASSVPFAVRADDAYVQGNQTLTVSINGTTGGNFEALTTSSTTSTTVVDDADATTVTLTASAASVAEGGTITYTATVNSPVTGSPLVVTLNNGQTITIPVGSSSASSAPFAVRADDAYAQGNQTVSVGISTTSGGNFEALTTTSTTSTTVTDDGDATTVSLSASAASVVEGGSIVYTATVANAVTGSPLVVTLSNGQTITIPVGQTSASSAPFAVRADDAYAQGNQTVTVGISGTSGGNFEAVTTGSPASTTVTDDADATTVTLTASAASVTEGGSITYTAAVNNPVTGSALVISLSNGQTITIPVGQSSASSAAFPVRADDAYLQGNQTLNVGITGTTGGNYEALATTSTASTTVTDDSDATTVTLTASSASVTEGGSIVYTATVNNAVTGSPLVITLNNGQTITIPVGQSSASSTPFAVRADDAYAQGNQTVTVGISNTSGGTYESLTTTSTATTTVTDDSDATVVTLTASAASVAEGGSVTYTAAVSNAVTGSPLVISLSNGQTITIPVGQSSASSTPFAVRADDAYAQGNQTLTVGINGTTGGNYEALTTSSTTSTTVTDDGDATTVTLTASTASVTEGGSIVYTATVNNAVTGSPLVITLNNGQTITIPVGQSSASSTPFAVRADDAYAQGNQAVTVGISGTTGGNFEALTTTSTATTTVTDDSDASVVTLTASSASVTEGGSITYTASVSNPVTGSALVISLSNGQSITIPVGASSASSTPFAVRADDAYVQGNQALTVGISGTTGGNFEALTTSSTTSTTVTDDSDATTVTLTASSASVVEGGSITYTATVNNAVTGSPLVITLNNGQTITIPVGQSSANSTPFAVRGDDAYVQGNQTVTVGISNTSGGNFEALTTTSTTSTTVTDDSDATTVTLTASAATVTEGGSITYTATVNNPVTGSPFVVTLSNGQTITIPVGSSSASGTPFAVRADDAYVQGNQTLTVGISNTSGGNYEARTTTSTVSSTVTDDADATTVTLTASSASVTEGGSITYTATVNNAVTGSPLVITLNNGQTITIPVGSSSASSTPFAVRADDAYAQGNQTVTASITGTSGGNYESLTTTSTASTTVTDDADPTTVTLTASTASVAEGGSITYTATLSNAVTGSALVINLSNGQQITIPVGQSSGTSPAFAVRADDAYAQGNQTLTVGVSSTSGGNYEALTTTSTTSTTVTDDNDASVVTLTASTASVAEGGTITYTAAVSNPVTGSPLVINLSNGQTITIPVGQSSGTSAAFAVRADDAYAQGNQTVTVGISSTSGGAFEALTTTSTASTTVTDDGDVTTVTLSASAASVTEGGSIVYTATVSNAVTGAPFVITLNNGQTITIPVGQTSASSPAFAVRADDAYVQGNQTVTVGISNTSGGNFEATNTASTASTTVADDADATTVTLTASAASVSEGGTITYTAAVNNPVTGSALVVNLSNGQTITIPVGASSASSTPFAVRADDAYLQGTQTLTVGITGTSGGNYEALTTTSTTSTTVTDDADATTVTLTASAAAVTEGGSIVYTASVNNPVTGSPFVITLTNGQQITIPVGASAASSAAVAVRADDAYAQGNQNVTVGISSTSGGNYEARTTTSTVTTVVSDDSDATTVTLTPSVGTVPEGGTITYTATVNNAVTGSPLVINLSNGQTITIPVGQSSGTSAAVAVRADDAYAQGNQAVTVSINSTSGGSYEALTTTSTASTTVTDDADATTVTLSASAASVTEGGSIVYTATVASAVTGSALVINLSNGQSITIPVGQTSASSAAFAVRADDAYLQGTQTVTVGISSTSGGNYEALTTTSTASTTVTDDADATTVTLTASSASVAEGGSVTYTAAVNNPVTGSPLVINLSNGQQITIPVGASSATSAAYVPRADDAYAQGTQAVSVGISSTSGGNYEALATTSTASVNVSDDADATTVSLSGTANLTEGGTASYTLTLSNPAQSAVTVTLSYSGTAANGSDYTGVATVTIPAGSSSASFNIATTNDTLTEPSETLIVSISGVSGGGFESIVAHPSNNAVTTTIADNDAPPTVDLDANNSTAGGTGYTATFTENGSAVSIADTDISITDVDSATLSSATITLTNAQAGDVLAAGAMPAGITASVSGNVVTLSGAASLAAYQTAIRAVTYANTGDNPSTTDRQISVVVNDGTSSSAAATAVIHVAAVNDAPVNTVPAAQSTAEDTPLVFSAANGNAITVADVDSGSVTTTLSVNNGTLTLGSIAGVIVVGNGTGSVQVTGTPAAVTAALNGTAYANTADYNGPATLTVSTSDGVAPAVVSTVGITVNPVVDIANDTASTNEDNAVTLSVLANDSFENGGRTITAINGSAITAGGPAVAVANGTVSLNASGQLIYTPTANYNGAASFSYTVTSGGVTETATVNVTVNAVNDAPVNTVPATQTTAEDTPRSITGLAIGDVDAGSASMTVTLTVTNGTLTVSGGTATIANSGTGTVTLTGTAAQINATLASNVTYVPSANFNGAASLTMTTNDNGNTGSGGALSDTDTVTINVTAVNDAPVATGSAVAGTEDTALVFNWAQFGVTDIDSASTSLGIRVSTLPADGTLQVYNGSAWVNVAANTLVTKATIDAGSFRFVPDANESGSDAYGGSSVGNQQADYARFTFTPNDGSLDGTAAMMRIDIAPVTDAPTVSHNASVQVTGTLSTLTSVGLSRDYYNAIATLTSGASSTNPDVGEVGIETAVPTSSALVTNVGVAGNLTGDTGVQVAADDAYRVQGLIYMQAGTSYVFSGYADDTVRLEVGGNTLMSGQWGGSGQAMAGTFTSNTFTPTVTGYYSIEFMVYNTSGPGSYDLNVSVNGATAVDLSTSNFLLFQSINQVDAAGGQRSAFIPNTTSGEGGYYPVVYDAGVQSRVYLAPVLASLVDTDGSESLAITLQGIPVGAVLTDGTNTFTASGASTSVAITSWNRSSLSITFPSDYSGSATLTAVATSTEAATGATATTSTSFAVTVDPTGTTTALAEIGTFNGDALIGQAGNDVYSVSQVGTGLSVSVTQGATGSIPAQSGTDTTGTIHQAFNTGGGNDYVQAGAGDDTIYLGDTGSSVHPVGGGAPTQAHVAAARVMTLADDTTLTSSTTGLFTNEADDTNANNNSAGNTSITTWSDVANGGSGNDVIYGQNGTDFLYGGTGNDYLNGGAGIDGLRGGAGDDTLVGGAGNDVLRGDAGADVFKWEFADRGAVGTPASDIIMDFNTATPANGGDVLDLRDLLQGEASAGGAAGNLSNYLHFSVSGGTTTIAISSSGGFSSGYSAGAVDQSIVLQNVDLTSGGALTTDQQIINDLLNKSKLLVDGT